MGYKYSYPTKIPRLMTTHEPPSRVLGQALGDYRAAAMLQMCAGNVQPSQPQVKDSFAANVS